MLGIVLAEGGDYHETLRTSLNLRGRADDEYFPFAIVGTTTPAKLQLLHRGLPDVLSCARLRGSGRKLDVHGQLHGAR